MKSALFLILFISFSSLAVASEFTVESVKAVTRTYTISVSECMENLKIVTSITARCTVIKDGSGKRILMNDLRGGLIAHSESFKAVYHKVFVERELAGYTLYFQRKVVTSPPMDSLRRLFVRRDLGTYLEAKGGQVDVTTIELD